MSKYRFLSDLCQMDIMRNEKRKNLRIGFEKLNLVLQGDIKSYYLTLIVMLQVILLHYSVTIVIAVVWLRHLPSVEIF